MNENRYLFIPIMILILLKAKFASIFINHGNKTCVVKLLWYLSNEWFLKNFINSVISKLKTPEKLKEIRIEKFSVSNGSVHSSSNKSKRFDTPCFRSKNVEFYQASSVHFARFVPSSKTASPFLRKRKRKKKEEENPSYIYTAWKNLFSVRFFIEFSRTHISIANKSFFRGVAAWSFESEKKKFINPRIKGNLTTNWLEEKNNIHGGGSDPGTTRISSLYRGMERNRPYLAMSIINRRFTWGVNFFTSFWKSLRQVLTRPGNF